MHNQLKSGFHRQSMESVAGHYSLDNADPVHAAGYLSPSLGGKFLGPLHMDLPEYQNAYLGSVLTNLNGSYGVPHLGKFNGLDNGLYGNHGFGMGMPYPASKISTATHTLLNSASPIRQNGRLCRMLSTARSQTGASNVSWFPENSAVGEGYSSSLLLELKSNKTRLFELSDIVGHAVEFRCSFCMFFDEHSCDLITNILFVFLVRIILEVVSFSRNLKLPQLKTRT